MAGLLELPQTSPAASLAAGAWECVALLTPSRVPADGLQSVDCAGVVTVCILVFEGTFLWELCDRLEAEKVACALAKCSVLMVSCRAGVAPVLGRAGMVEQCVLQPNAAPLCSHCQVMWMSSPQMPFLAPN